MLIRKFSERTCIYNEQMMHAVNRLDLACVNVETASTLNELSSMYIELIRKQIVERESV